MRWVPWLAGKLHGRRHKRAADAQLERLAQAPIVAARRNATALLARLRAEPGPHVHLGETPWGSPVAVPLAEIVGACGLTTGGMGTGKTMFALLPIEAIISRLPDVAEVGFGVLDAKGELFERVLWLLGQRYAQLDGEGRAALLSRIVIIDFAERQAISSYNILARWPYVEPDYFVTSRLETLRDLIPGRDSISLRGAGILKNVLLLLAEFGLPVTYLVHVLSSETLRRKLLTRSKNEAVQLYFARHFPLEGKATVAALRARMDAVFASESVRLALAGPTAPDFCRLQNEGKIILVNCAGPMITRGVRLLLQGLVLADIRQAIFARPNRPPVTYLWCADEAQNFFLTSQQRENMTDILTMARSFGSFFYFLCQNLSTAVPDSRILEILHTNIRWSMTFRSTPRDALFLRAALPVTGRMGRPQIHPYRRPGYYSPAEERAILHDGIAHLPDRIGYLWLKARSPEALKIRTPSLPRFEGPAFRREVEAARADSTLGGRLSREVYDRLIAERDREWLGAEPSERPEPEMNGKLEEGGFEN